MSKSKAINVKIPTAKIIAALEQALNKLELDYTSQAALEAEYNKEYESWRQEMTKILMANAHHRNKCKNQSPSLGKHS
jgi:hypothetical protein